MSEHVGYAVPVTGLCRASAAHLGRGLQHFEILCFRKANVSAHHERPHRDFSALAEAQRGRDAVARKVRLSLLVSKERGICLSSVPFVPNLLLFPLSSFKQALETLLFINQSLAPYLRLHLQLSKLTYSVVQIKAKLLKSRHVAAQQGPYDRNQYAPGHPSLSEQHSSPCRSRKQGKPVGHVYEGPMTQRILQNKFV
jgi:hypothetical protein